MRPCARPFALFRLLTVYEKMRLRWKSKSKTDEKAKEMVLLLRESLSESTLTCMDPGQIAADKCWSTKDFVSPIELSSTILELPPQVNGRALVENLSPLFETGFLLQFVLTKYNRGRKQSLTVQTASDGEFIGRFLRRSRILSQQTDIILLGTNEEPLVLLHQVSSNEYTILGPTPLTFWDTPCLDNTWYPWYSMGRTDCLLEQDKDSPWFIKVWNGKEYQELYKTLQVDKNVQVLQMDDAVVGQVAYTPESTRMTIPPGVDPTLILCIGAIVHKSETMH